MSEQPRGSGFSTLALHAGSQPTWPANAAFSDSLPLAAQLETATFEHPAERHREMLEERIATLEGGTAAVAVASGAAANLVTFYTLLQPGDALVAPRRLRSRRQLKHGFGGFGWQVDWAETDSPESFVEALSDRTKAILIDSIGPGGEMSDIAAIASVARRARMPLIVDNTLATPYLVRPLEHGADIVISSAAFLAGSGGADGGLIVDGGTFDWAGRAAYPALSEPQPGHDDMIFADMFGNFAFASACRLLGLGALGATLPASNARCILNGIETLALRMQRQCDSALAVAQHLSRHNAVAWVRYAGLDDDAGRGLAVRYSPRGAGALLAFGLSRGGEAASDLVRRLRLFAPGTEPGGTRSLVLKSAAGAGDEAVRLSIGLEDATDIITELDQALGT